MVARLLLVVLVGGSAGCTSALAVRFEADTGCSERITAKKLGLGLYEVRGCGRRARYVCVHNVCVRERERNPERTVVVTRPAPARPRQTERSNGVQLGRDRDGHRAVRLALRYGDAQLLLLGVPAEDPERFRVQARDGSNRRLDCRTFQLHGRGRTVEVSGNGRLPVAELRAVAPTLFGVDLCGVQLRVFDRGQQQLAELLESFDSIAESAVETPTPAPTEVVEATTPPGPAEPTIRARLEERKVAILACLGGEPGAVTVRWTAAGELNARVSGREEGASIHGCVRAAIGELRITATESGELMHPVAP